MPLNSSLEKLIDAEDRTVLAYKITENIVRTRIVFVPKNYIPI